MRSQSEMERSGADAQWRSHLQDHQAAKGRLKSTSIRPCFRNQSICLNPPLEPVSKVKQVSRSKKDILGNAMADAQEVGKLGARSMQQTNHTALKKTSQRAGGVHSVQEGNVVLPAAAQTRGRLTPSSSGHLTPERDQKLVQEPATAAAAHMGRGSPSAEAPHSQAKGLQDRLTCLKENLDPQAYASWELMRTADSLRTKGVLRNRQNTFLTSRSVLDPEGGITDLQPKEEPVLYKFRRTLPEPKSVFQPLQSSWFLPASANLLHKNQETEQGKTTTVRQPGTAPGENLKHHCQPHSVRLSIKSPTLGKPQEATNLKSCLNPWPRPTVKKCRNRKDVKVVPPGHTAACQDTGSPKHSCSTHSSKTLVLEDGLGRDKPDVPKTSGLHAACVPRTPAAAGDRRKQLEEWVASKGKTYKRPPMSQLWKQGVQPSHSKAKAQEKQEHPEQRSQAAINTILTDCLKLTEEVGIGKELLEQASLLLEHAKDVDAEEVSAVLSLVPQAEKFAKFWICQAKLMAHSVTFDVLELYKGAVIAGAEPIEEFRRTVLDILKDAHQELEGKKTDGSLPQEPRTPCPGERQPIPSAPGLVGRPMASLPRSIKLLVTPASRREFPEGRKIKFLTPVRRSERIGRVKNHYPDMLKDHDPVVSSLSEILDAEEDTCFFRKNKALPEVTELEALSSYPFESS